MSLEQSLDEGLLARLPLPLGQLYRRAPNAKTPLEQHLTSFYLWEAGIKLFSAAAVAEYVARGASEPLVEQGIRNLARPALGHWWECTRLLLPVLARHDADFQQLRELLFGKQRDLPRASYLAELLTEEEKQKRILRSSVRLDDLVERLIGYRLQEIGHGAGAQRTDAFHERMAPALFLAFTEVFTLLDPLAKRQLFFLDSFLFRNTAWVVKGYRLVGENPTAKVFPIQQTGEGDRPVPNLVYLLGEQPSSLIALSPLLRYDADAGEMFFFNRRGKASLEYLCYTTGRVLHNSPVEVELSFLNRVLGRPADPESEPPNPENEITISPDEASSPRWEPRRRIGEFEIQERIGGGGFANVYRAWQPTLGRQVAVKVFDRFRSPEGVESFRREIQALARVDHPNLVKVYSWGEEADHLYYVMEFLEGEPVHRVAERWREGAGRPGLMNRGYINQVVHITRQVVEALAALHNASVIHGDPKPGNIIVTPDGSRAVLIDPLVPAVVPEGAIYGTPAYMSPERIVGGKQSDHRSDLYTIGVVLWELLAGKKRFPYGSFVEVLEAVLRQEPDPVRPHNPSVPPDLEAIVLKCLALGPAQRYATARDLADDLRRWLEGEVVHARPPSPLRRITRFLRRYPWSVAMALILSLTTAALFSWVTGVFSSEEPETPAPQLTPGDIGWFVAGALAVVVLIQWFTLMRRRKAEPAAPTALGSEPPKEAPPEAGATLTPLEPVPQEHEVETTRPPPQSQRPRLRAPADEAFSSQAVVLRYPAPIAIAYRRFCGRGQPRDRLAQLFDTFEITLKYLVYLGLSDLCHCRLRSGPPVAPLSKHQGFDLVRRPTRMTLGRWVRSLLDVADELAGEPDRFAHELPQVCGSKSFLDREIFGWIKDNRDAATHRKGGISLHSEKCVPLVREARPRLERLLQEVAFLRRYPLGFVTAGYPGAGNRSRYRVHSCMGARVAFGEEVYPMETDVQLPRGVPFVAAPDESRVLCLWPFVLQRESDATQRPSLYVFEEMDPDRNYLSCVRAAAIDHEDVWVEELHPADARDHDWLWEALRVLPQTVAVTPALRLAEGLAESLVGRLTGEELGEHKQYRLVGPIARGGFGTVYDALDVRSKTRVAVKVLEDHEGLEARDNLAQLQRFQREYEKLQSAGRECPGIIQCFEWGIDILGRREYPWFSMEFAAGGDLNERLQERRAALHGGLVWEKPELRTKAIEEFRAVVEAVAHLHDLNIIHRDIKPANVLILDEGKLRLSDFGLVKEVDRQRTGASIGPGSSRGAVVGTRDYMAPEQERGDPVTKAADVYSLSIVLAELVTGYRPEPAQGVAAGSPVECDGFVDRLPEPLRRLILHWTDVDPAERPSDARYALHQFEQVVKKLTK
jgi:serine/threonine protein kinase